MQSSKKRGITKPLSIKATNAGSWEWEKECLLNIGCFISVDMFSLQRRINDTEKIEQRFLTLYMEGLIIVATSCTYNRKKTDGGLGLIADMQVILTWSFGWKDQNQALPTKRWNSWRKSWSSLWIRFYLTSNQTLRTPQKANKSNWEVRKLKKDLNK